MRPLLLFLYAQESPMQIPNRESDQCAANQRVGFACAYALATS